MEDEFYIKFADKFRGTRELIKDRLKVYLPIIAPLKTISQENHALDLGCGRGEWLEQLAENGWQGAGVDLNKGMVILCEQRGLNAICEDSISYLRSVKSETLSVVTGFHIAEHLPFESLLELIKETNRVLLPAGILILETPNPDNLLVSSSNFYLDPTHKHPLPADLLSFITEYCGFYRSIIFRLQETQDLLSKQSMELFDVISGVSRDCAIIAQKSASPQELEAFETVFEIKNGITLDNLAKHYDTQIKETFQNISIEITDLQTELNETRTSLNSVIDERERLQEALIEARCDLQGIREDLNIVRTERDKYILNLNIAEDNLEKVQAELGNIITERERLQTKFDRLRADFEQLVFERDNLKSRLNAANNYAQSYQAKVNHLAADRDTLQNSLDEARVQRDSYLAQSKKANADRNAIEEEYIRIYNSR